MPGVVEHLLRLALGAGADRTIRLVREAAGLQRIESRRRYRRIAHATSLSFAGSKPGVAGVIESAVLSRQCVMTSLSLFFVRLEAERIFLCAAGVVLKLPPTDLFG